MTGPTKNYKLVPNGIEIFANCNLSISLNKSLRSPLPRLLRLPSLPCSSGRSYWGEIYKSFHRGVRLWPLLIVVWTTYVSLVLGKIKLVARGWTKQLFFQSVFIRVHPCPSNLINAEPRTSSITRVKSRPLSHSPHRHLGLTSVLI